MSPNKRWHNPRLSAWAIHHPIGVIMLTLAVVVLGYFALQRLAVDLLPHLIRPEVRVRIIDPGVPAKIMEDKITRQLEEQLAITEDAISVESRTTLGRSSVNLSFQFGTDIDAALRDASTRLDRAKRFLPDTIDPPIIYKRDPSQRPILVLIASSPLMSGIELRTWVDDVFSKWFLNLPGVASVEVGGGLVREIRVLPDQARLAGLGLTLEDVAKAIRLGNLETPAGRVRITQRELATRTDARFTNLEELEQLPIGLPGGGYIHLNEIAQVTDSHEDEKLRVRLDGTPGVKISIQKQPNSNTVAVVDSVMQRLQSLREQKVIPGDIAISPFDDQSIFIRNSLRNATLAALSGAILAMLVVYLFLGNLKRTLIIGSAIPIAIMVTFLLMDLTGLTLNIMTLGGLAVGIGMLVDNTIVMLENIYRHQKEEHETANTAGVVAAGEVQSAIIASTSTNLAAVLPFLFISGMVGLLFKELIITISAAIIASLVVALSLIPALGTRVHDLGSGPLRRSIDRLTEVLRHIASAVVKFFLHNPIAQFVLLIVFLAGMLLPYDTFFVDKKQVFLPEFDTGQIEMRIGTDQGMRLQETDKVVSQIEQLIETMPAVRGIFTTSGGFIFGRSEYERPDSASITVQLAPREQRDLSSDQWIKLLRKKLNAAQLAGTRIRAYKRSVRGIQIQRGTEQVSLRIQGPDLERLEAIGTHLVTAMQDIKGLSNIERSNEDPNEELRISIDRERAASLGLNPDEVANTIRIAIDGEVASDYIDGDRSYDIRVRLPDTDINNVQRLRSLLLHIDSQTGHSIHLSEIAQIEYIAAAREILRDNQRRMVEVTANIDEDLSEGELDIKIQEIISQLEIPDGYSVYDAGITQALQQGRDMFRILLGLALFLVFVVLAIQYESLRNPVIILLGIPFAAIGVSIGIDRTGIPLSMPVWLGLMMLAGIVVNNAIVLVEVIEIQRDKGLVIIDAIIQAVRLRLRPILMTTLTTIVGLFPLALGLGEGSEMLQPLAITIVSGLLFSLFVSLLLIPVLYLWFHAPTQHRRPQAQSA